MSATLTSSISSSRATSLKRNRMSRSAVEKRVPISSGKLCSIRNIYARRRSVSLESSVRPVVVSPEPQSTVRFSPMISIREIPSRKDYSKEEKEAMWTPRLELRELVRKNNAEVAFEGRDWRKAPEENDFGKDGDGNPLHPIFEVKTLSSLLPCKKRKLRLARRRLPLSLSCGGKLEHEQENKRRRVESEIAYQI